MACRNCYKYPFCEKCGSPKDYPLYYENGKQKCNCPDFKKKRIEMEEQK